MKPKNLLNIGLFSLIILASCGGIGSSFVSSNSSSVSTSTTNSATSSTATRRSVNEMISQLNEKSYTLDLVMEGFGVLSFAVDQPLYQVTYTFDDGELVSEYFVDLTNDFAPVLYGSLGGGTWRTSLSDSYSLTMGLLSPLMFVDPTLIQDSWFDWNSETDLYVLNPQYLDELFQNSPLLGVEDLMVSMNADNEITITLGGVMGDVSAGNVLYTLIYSDIGSTEVTLPTNTTSIAGDFFFELLTNATNHYYDFYVTPVGGTTEIVSFGSRLDDTFLLSSMNGFQGEIVSGFNQDYYSIEAGQFIQIQNSATGYAYSLINETEYNKALNDFYPIAIFDITEAWLDLENSSGLGGYPIKQEFVNLLLNIDLGQQPTNIEASIFFEESFWSGLSVNVNLLFDLGNEAYQANFRLHSVNLLTSIHPPINRGTTLTLEAMLAIATQTNSYYVEQKIVDENGLVISFDYASYRDGDNYLLFGVSSQGFWRYDYFIKQEDNFIKYIYNFNTSSFVRSVIDEATYQAEVIDAAWLRLENFSLDFIESESSSNTYTLTTDAWLSLLGDQVLDQYTITSGTIEIINAYEESPAFRFKFETTTIQNGSPLFITIDVSAIGVISIEPPLDSEEETKEPEVMATLEDYVAIFSAGLTSYHSVLFSYDQTNTLNVYQEILVGENAGSTFDFLTGDYLNLFTIDGAFIEEQGNVVNETLTRTSLDAEIFAQKISDLQYIQFDIIALDDFISLVDQEDGLYQKYLLKEDRIADIITFPLATNEVVENAFLVILDNAIVFQIEVTNTETNQTTTYYIYVDNFNTSIDIFA